MRLIPTLMLALAVTLPAQGQDAKEIVRIKWSVEPQTITAGGTVTVHADVTIDDGWYIYAVDQTENATPSEFVLTAPKGLTPGKLQAPTPTVKTMEYVGKLKIHKGSFRFSQPVTVAKSLSGAFELTAELKYQVCKDVCLESVGQAHTFTIQVKPAAGPKPEDPPVDPVLPEDGGGDLLGGDDPLGGGLIPGFDAGNDQVSIKATVHPARAPPGDLVELRLDVTVIDGWYIYATNTPFGGKTILTPALPTGFAFQGRLVGPMPKAVREAGVGLMYKHYGKTRFVQRIRVPKDAKPGKVELGGELEWQACDDVCIPGKASVKVALTVDPQAEPTGVQPTTGEAPVPPEPGAKTGATKTAAKTGETVSKTGAEVLPPAEPTNWLALILASIVFGFAMLAMPCTYPMIPITVSLFSKGKTLTRRQTLVRAGVYAGGIVISFTLVGGLVQVIFGGEGQGALQWFATNLWLNLAIGIIFVYFAFSFFGYYELGLPAPLQKLMQLGTAKQDADGTVPLWSLFLMGFFFVLTSYTCGAPVVLGLFATAASTPSPVAIVGATFVFACTVAAPFFFLAMVPSGIRVMPKSGSWFSVFKVVLGFVELGFAVKFFRGADLQFKAFTLLSRPVTLALWSGLCVFAAVYLVGRFPLTFPHDPPLRPVGRRRALWAVMFLGLAGYFGYGLTGAKLHADVEAFILEKKEEVDNTVKFVLPYRVDLAGLEEAKQKAAAQGPTGRAFLLFTGHT